MSLANVKQQIVSNLKATTGINNVYGNIKMWKDIDGLPITDGKVQWWEVYMTRMSPNQYCNNLVYYTYRIVIDGYYAMAEDNSTQVTVENLAEAIVKKFMSDLDLGGYAEFGDMEGDEDSNTGLPVVEFGMTTRSNIGRALHQIRITVNVRDATPKTITL